MPKDAVKLTPLLATAVLREALEQKQAATPLPATTPVRVGGEWLRRYSAGELELEPVIKVERKSGK